jgi:cytochrome c oxidase cbb3-type subunit 4
MSFEAVSHFAQTWGLALLVVLFAGVLVYALWPGNRRRFERAARAPLDEDKDA